MSAKRVVLMGPPGAGKGTQAAGISKSLGIKHISTGDILREAVKNRTELGKKAEGFLTKGELVPDELVVELVLTALENQNGFLLDGFPRNNEQAEILDRMLSEKGLDLEKAVAIIVPDEAIIKRLSGRRVCGNCGATYHITNNPPEAEGKCDNCGGDLYQREDDKEDTIINRLRVYKEQTMPLIEYYEAKDKLARIDGQGSVEQVSERILSALS